MPPRPPIRAKCVFPAWILAWVVAIYLPSAFVALAGLSPEAEGRSLPAAIFAVADEVAPLAKIAFAVLLLALLLAGRRARLPRPARIAADMLLAAAAMVAVVGFIPADWSRGFAIGLSGERFAPLPLTIYLASAALSGLAFNLAEARCAAKG